MVAKAFIPNPEKREQVDHIDNNKTNNNFNNLRWATQKENSRNKGISKNNTSCLKGVMWRKDRSKWCACIKVDGINIHLGYFNTKEEAHEKRISAVNSAFGEFKNKCEDIKGIFDDKSN